MVLIRKNSGTCFIEKMFFLRKYIETAGIYVKERRKEKRMLDIIAIARSQNNSPKMPGKRKKGVKTITVVSDELKFDW